MYIEEKPGNSEEAREIGNSDDKLGVLASFVLCMSAICLRTLFSFTN